MASTALYTSLQDREGPEKENVEGESLEAPFLDGDSPVFGKKRVAFRRYGCWIVYFGSILLTAGLLSGVQQSLRNHRCDCWDKFNYFCKRVLSQRTKLDELQRLNLLHSSGQRRCRSLPLCPSTVQRLAMVSKPFQGSTDAKGRKGLVRYHEM